MVLCLPNMRMVVGIGIVDMVGGGVEPEAVVFVAVGEVGIMALKLMLSRTWEATIKSLHFKAVVMFHLISSLLSYAFAVKLHYSIVLVGYLCIVISNNYNAVSIVWSSGLLILC